LLIFFWGGLYLRQVLTRVILVGDRISRGCMFASARAHVAVFECFVNAKVVSALKNAPS